MLAARTIRFVLLYGPPLAKIRAPRLIATRQVRLMRVEPGLSVRLVERADIISEGRDDGGRYFGTTSVALNVDDPAAARALAFDLHVRTTLLRIARREAVWRSSGALGTLLCEISFQLSQSSLVFSVEVEAALDIPRAAFA